MRAVLGNERLVDDDAVAARRLQTEHVPVADDLVVLARQQEGAHVGRAALARRRRNDRAEEHPVAVLAAAREAPAARELQAAIDALDLADRLVRRGDEYARVGAPDILLRADVEQTDLELVRGDDAKHPGARHVGFCDRELHVEEHLRIHLVAAPALRLQDPEEARVLEVLDGCGGERCGLARGR